MARLPWFVARRYLSARRKGRLLSFITWIALGGITVGVTALVVVLGVMDGMQEDLQEKILASSPHVLVLERGPALRMNRWQAVADSVRTEPGVEAVQPFAHMVAQKCSHMAFLRRSRTGLSHRVPGRPVCWYSVIPVPFILSIHVKFSICPG